MTETLKILENLGIKYEHYVHQPITDFEVAHAVDEQFHIEGQENKSLLLKGKSGKFYCFVTIEGVRMDRKFFKDLLGEKVGISSGEELEELSGYVVGCAAPFPWPEDVEIIVDNEVFNHEKQICSAGLPTESMVVASEDLKKVYSTLPNKVTYVDYPKPEEE